MWSEGKQFEQEESLGGARAEHLSGWREIDAVKQSYMDCSANFLTSELFWKRVREPANDSDAVDRGTTEEWPFWASFSPHFHQLRALHS